MQKTSTNYLPYLPFVTAIWQFSAVSSAYTLGILLNKKLDFIPYPSDLSEAHPEKGIFHIALNIGGILMFSVMLLRYMQINTSYPRRFRKLNMLSFTAGIIMTFSQVSISAFPMLEMSTVHYVAASSYFFFGCVYMVTQCHISKNLKKYHNKCIISARIICSIIGCLCPFGYFIGRFFTPESESRYHLLQISEWLLAFIFIVFICSFTWDFNKLKFRCYNTDFYPIKTNDLRGHNYIDYLRKQKRFSSGRVDVWKNSQC